MTSDQHPRQKPRAIKVLLNVVWIIFLILGAAAGHEYWVRTRPRTHLHDAMPKLYEQVSHQRELLTKAIEAYKGKPGSYPPDHVVSLQPLVVDAVTNQLLYELLGTRHDPAGDAFAPARFPSIKRALIESFFNASSFRNAALKTEEVLHFIDVADITATVAIHNKPDVALLGYFPTWEGIQPDIYSQIELSSWRYNSTAPMHNPGAY